MIGNGSRTASSHRSGASNTTWNFAQLLKAGSSSARVDGASGHVAHRSATTKTSRWWLDGVLGQGVDVLASPATRRTATVTLLRAPAEWATTFNRPRGRVPDSTIAEYSQSCTANDVMFQLPQRRGLAPTGIHATDAPQRTLFTTDGEWNDFVTIGAIGLIRWPRTTAALITDFGLPPPASAPRASTARHALCGRRISRAGRHRQGSYFCAGEQRRA